MLGNFSFGDYFKADAIRFAWEVSTEIFQFAPERIWPTIFHEDDDAFEIWRQYVPAERIVRLGEESNYWAMGDTGPCGPCSELLYDRGSDYGDATNPAQPGSEERYLEFWNLVFMQYNRSQEGRLDPLPKPSIDTGAGIERVVSLQMEVSSVFETDVLRGLIGQIEQFSEVFYDPKDPVKGPAFCVIADHLRSLAFAIADGAQPSNVERGYVLRKILRRAVRYGRLLGLDAPFLAKGLPALLALMGEDYPELRKAQGRIADILTQEEEAFFRTLRRGGNLLSQVVDHARRHQRIISGDDAFKLKDTYGLPFEEIVLLAKDGDLTVDVQRYKQLENEAKERSRSTQKSVVQTVEETIFTNYLKENEETEFLGYTQKETKSRITALVLDGKFVQELSEGNSGIVILNKSPFYAEMGGQIGDTGTLHSETQRFAVSDCIVPFKGIIGHIGTVEKGVLRVGDEITAAIDAQRRRKIACNHTATHLLHWGLHQLLGEHVKQAGSVVEPDRLRFDFSHHKQLSEQEIRHIEDLVNAQIRANTPVKKYELSYEEATKRTEIKQFFGEKYDRTVRVVDIDFSKELCGGTHVDATGDIGLFRIIKEGSIAAGVRRIEAVTGLEAEAFSRESESLVHKLAALLKSQPQKLQERIEKLLEENKQLETELKTVKRAQLADSALQLMKQKESFRELPVVLFPHLTLSPEELKICAEETASLLKSGAILLGSVFQEKCHLVAHVSDDWVKRGIKANEWIQAIAPLIEGSGGGRPTYAQAGGKAPQKLEEAFTQARTWLIAHLTQKE